jgi:phosphotransferase system IIB component
MFTQEDFEIPLEKQLRLRMILDEIDHCENVDALQENLKMCTKTLVTYQHILGRITEQKLKEEIAAAFGNIEIPKDSKANG